MGTPLEVIPGATAAGLLAGALLPLLGLWVVLQHVVFLGVTLAQVAAAGVALGLFLHLSPLACGFAACLLMVAWLLRRRAGGAEGMGDATLGAAFCVASALSLLFVSRSPVELDQVHHVLHGNLIYSDPSDVWLVGATIATGVALTLLFFRRLLLCAFDAETAAALGLRPRGWAFLLFGVLAVVLSVSTRTTGSLLTFALLVLPPLAALQLGRGMLGTFLLSSFLGFAGTLGGLLLAVGADLHLESSVTLGVFATLPVAWGWGRHPLIGLGLAGAVVAALVAVTATPPGHQHEPAVVRDEHAETSLPWELSVHLENAHVTDGVLSLDWSFDLHPGAHAKELPPALWLVLSVGGTTHEVPLMEDTAALPSRPLQGSGSVSFVVDGEVRRVTGQVWTARTSDIAALPVSHAHVVECAVP